jgi:hypothetical protein
VHVECALDPEAELDLLDRFQPAAVWFSDDEYAMVASAGAPGWVDLGSIRRALTSDESADGATAFQQAFGAEIEPVYGSKETGVVAALSPLPGIQLAIVDEEGSEVPAGQVGDVAVRGDTPSLFAGYDRARGGAPRPDEWFRVGGRGAIEDDGSLRLVSRAPREIDQIEAEALDEGGPAAVDVAEPDRLPTIDDPHRRDEAQSRELAGRAAANERRRVEEAERSEREAELAVQRLLAEEAKRGAQDAARAEQQRLADEDRRRAVEEKRRAEDEKRREKERRREAAERAERERLAAEATARQAEEERQRAEKQRREEERHEKQRASERQKVEERRHREEAKSRKLAERAAAKERRRAEDEKRRTRERGRGAAEQAERERLAPEILSRISQYSMTAPPADPDRRRDAEEPSQSGRRTDREEHRHTV